MNAIVIMAKEPRPNKVKTRMIPDLDPIVVSKIYQGFLLDRFEQIGKIPNMDHYIAFTPRSSENAFKCTVPEKFSLLLQEGRDLGERLSNVSYELFEKGYEKVVIMDSDSPNLPSRFIKQSFGIIDDSDLVLGPCEDGGYYLVGMRQHTPEIFVDIPWSTPNVTETTVNKAQSARRSIYLLEKWYDVDTKDDLLRLRNDLEQYNEIPNDIYYCENTYNIISKIDIPK
jgi:rSAM/selenodomain-associated transferase 1